MRVLVADLPGCGAASLSRALEEIGMNNMGFAEQFEWHEKEWMRLMKGGPGEKRVDLHEMFEYADSCTDMPACFFWEEILERFPDAKIIITKMDEDVWFEQLSKEMKMRTAVLQSRWMLLLSPSMRRLNSFFKSACVAIFGCEFSSGEKLNPLVCKMTYRKHVQSILQRVPRHRLLHFDPRQEWRPLCDFLDKPRPQKPFPRNDDVIKHVTQRHPVYLRARDEAVMTSVLAGAAGVYVGYKLFVTEDWNLGLWDRISAKLF